MAANCSPPFPEAEAMAKVEQAWKYRRQGRPFRVIDDGGRQDNTGSRDTGVADIPKVYRLTELGNAERLVDRHGGGLHYCYPWREWFTWTGIRWEPDKTGMVTAKAKETVRNIYKEAADVVDKELRAAMVRHALKSEKDYPLRAMLSLAQSEPGIPVLPEDLDKHLMLLNCKNGTLDLTTGRLQEAAALVRLLCAYWNYQMVKVALVVTPSQW